MKSEEILARVIEQTADAFERSPDVLKGETRFLADLAAESIDFVDLTFRLEREFGIKVDEEELFDAELPERPQTILDVAVYVERKLKPQ